MKTANVKKSGFWGTKGLALMALSMMALLTIDLGLIKAAKADLKVRARVHTPNLVIDVGHGGDYVYRPNYRHRRPLPPVKGPCIQVTITHNDRRIAKRLARRTGYNKRTLLGLRRDGYNWWRIGRILDIHPRVVRMAVHGKKWNRGRYADAGGYHNGGDWDDDDDRRDGRGGRGGRGGR